MKIGIMTFWESQNNYGQLLQAYALQTYLNNKGHDTFLIKYHRILPNTGVSVKRTLGNRIINFRIKRFVNNRIINLKISKEKERRNFDSFRNLYLKFTNESYTSLEELKEHPPKADIYVCGSDQVWNNTFSVSCEAFLLGFGHENIKRIAYAASFGQRQLNEETFKLFQEHLHKFDRVAVREKSGLEICKEVGYSNPHWVPDPTLLFKKDDWLKILNISDGISKKKSKKVFLYTLGISEFEISNLYIKYAKKLPKTEVIHVSANNDYSGNTYPTITDWLKHINSSDFVITNSFHGAVFSIIFNKNFVLIPKIEKKYIEMNERIESLLTRLNLTEHISYTYDENKLESIMNKKINWSEVNLIINDWKKEADALWDSELSA